MAVFMLTMVVMTDDLMILMMVTVTMTIICHQYGDDEGDKEEDHGHE